MANINNYFYCIVLISVMINVVLCENYSDQTERSDLRESRTFGHHFLKRISFAIIPAAFVIGVVTTLLAALTIVSMKGLGVGVILLVIAVGQMLARAIPQQVAAPYSAPIPIVYSHRSTAAESAPIWVETKDW